MDKKTWTGLNRSGKNRTLTALVKSTSIYNDGTTGHLIRKSSGEFNWPAGKSRYISPNFRLFIYISCLVEIEAILFRLHEAVGSLVSLYIFVLVRLTYCKNISHFQNVKFWSKDLLWPKWPQKLSEMKERSIDHNFILVWLINSNMAIAIVPCFIWKGNSLALTVYPSALIITTITKALDRLLGWI